MAPKPNNVLQVPVTAASPCPPCNPPAQRKNPESLRFRSTLQTAALVFEFQTVSEPCCASPPMNRGGTRLRFGPSPEPGSPGQEEQTEEQKDVWRWEQVTTLQGNNRLETGCGCQV